jgi:3-deoxy-manno-octulosonate cytidylyltransferase (CMP-KDO synthetase)
MTLAGTVARVVIIVPARYQSTRYPGKPLALIRGAGGASKPLLERTLDVARAVTSASAVYVATDDDRVAAAATAAGAAVLKTPADCANGTERVAAALGAVADAPDFVVNLQGDALLTPPGLVDALIAHMADHPDCQVATVAIRCSPSAYRHLVEDQQAGRSGGTTVVLNRRGEALYFSKRVLPFIAPGSAAEQDPPVLLHLGLYAYRAAALARYRAAVVPDVEALEGLEQLRFLVEGVPVEVVVADPPRWDVIELNNPTDLAPIEAILAARGIS